MYNFTKVQPINDKEMYSHFLENSKVFIYDENDNFSSWDIDNNEIYSEWYGEEAKDKNIDLYPDVCLGRLACNNKFEVKKIVKKQQPFLCNVQIYSYHCHIIGKPVNLYKVIKMVFIYPGRICPFLF